MIYELRTYTLYPGKLSEYLGILEQVMPVREKYSKLTGFWYTEIGELNQVVHIWAYNNLEHRTQVRQALAKDSEWLKTLEKLTPFITKMENKILVPANFSPMI